MLSKLFANLLRALFYGAVAVVGVAYWIAPIHIAVPILVGVVAFMFILVVITAAIPPLRKFVEAEFPPDQNMLPDTPAQKEFKTAFSPEIRMTSEKKNDL